MRWVTCGLLAVGLALMAFRATGGDAPEQPKVSSYAPAEDVIAQVEYFVKHAGEALADKASYDEVKQTAVERDSNTLAVLGLMLAMSDEDHKLKGAAPAIIKTSQALAEEIADFDKATAALAEVKKAVAGELPKEGAVEWEAVASMSPLMKQVPVIHAPMKRGATDERRFKRQAAKTAGEAATLAAIAQAAMFNTDHATEDQIPQWEKFCAQMRDACGAVNSAARSGNAAQAAEAIVALQKSCDDCHAVFRAE
jgi:hypothetical protein